MTLNTFYRHFLQQLQQLYSREEAKVITSRIFENRAALTHGDIIKDPQIVLSEKKMRLISDDLQELIHHKPVQYVLGETWFYNLNFIIDENVLIPRPETEELVKWVTDDCISAQGNKKKCILDVGTGSGCIAIALKKNLLSTEINAIDISNAALELAKKNAKKNNVDVVFTKTDFLDEKEWKHLPEADIIVSNPPYIPAGEKEGMDKNILLFEPQGALFVPNDRPLLFYEKIIAFSKTHLKTNGKIYAEIHENYAKETAALFAEAFKETEIKKDINEKNRMIKATRCR